MNPEGKREREDRVIAAFVRTQRRLVEALTVVVCRPDRHPPGSGCDALVVRGNERCALDHTTIDVLKSQRADAAAFRVLTEGLEEAVEADSDGDAVDVYLPVEFCLHRKQAGRLKPLVRDAVLSALKGAPGDGEPIRLCVATYPSDEIEVCRHSDLGQNNCLVQRYIPRSRQPTTEMRQNLKTAIQSKARQLAPYRESSMRTITLLDSDDRAFTSNRSLAELAGEALLECGSECSDEVFVTRPWRGSYWSWPIKLCDMTYPETRHEFERYSQEQIAMLRDTP